MTVERILATNTEVNAIHVDGSIARHLNGHVQDVMLEVRAKDGKVMSENGLQLPSPLKEFGCDTTSFDTYAYAWEARTIAY